MVIYTKVRGDYTDHCVLVFLLRIYVEQGSDF